VITVQTIDVIKILIQPDGPLKLVRAGFKGGPGGPGPRPPTNKGPPPNPS